MHEKFARDGLLVVSVNLDDPADPEARPRAEKFLASKNASTVNVMLDEKPEVAEKMLRIEGLPTVFVFNREGRYARFPSADKPDFDHADIEKLVTELLKK